MSVAIIGLDQAGHFIDSEIYESSVKQGVENQMRRADQNGTPGFDSRRLFYENRMKGDRISVKPRRDCGVVHNANKLAVFINDVASDHVQVYFGIDENFIFPDFQNVMLVDNAVVLTDIDDEEEFAFDRGTGCCPEQ